MSYKNWSNEDLINAIKSSFTKSEVLKKLNLSVRSSGNFQTIDKYIKKLNLDISHFKSEKLENFKNKAYTIEDILTKNSLYNNTGGLKKKLIDLNLLNEVCAICNIIEWQNQKLTLHLDHINGDRFDNRLENLRLLCPNCHSQTSTYCRGLKPLHNTKCIDCDVNISSDATRCSSCHGISVRDKKSKIIWPELEILKKMVEELGYVACGKKLGGH